MENDIKTILRELGTLGNKLETVEERLGTLGNKLEILENKVDTGFEEIGETTHAIITMFSERFDKVESSLGRRYQEIDELRDRERLLETRVDKLEVVR